MICSLIICTFLISGCSQIPAYDRTIERMNTLNVSINKINPSAKAIQLGMSKEQVYEAWGKPDWKDTDDNTWNYSNYNKLGASQHPVTYNIIFNEGIVSKIIENIWSEKRLMSRTIDL